MLDNQLIKIFLPILQQGFLDRGLIVKVQQAYQPVQTGTPIAPLCTFFKVIDHRYGHPYKISYYDSDLMHMRHKERQVYESTWQIGALSIQDPTNEDSITAMDIINTAAEILQSDATINDLKTSDVGILRISEIRNVFHQDDMRQYESEPSFDVILRHAQERIIDIEGITAIEGEVINVSKI
jgi:hypothetical protein